METSDGPETRAAVEAAAVLRIVGAIDDYLYTNEHCADGSRRSVFSGPNREKMMGGQPPPGADTAAEWERLIHPDDWHAHLAHRARLQRGESSDVRYRLCGYDGVVRWINASTRPVHENGSVFVDGIVSDVTRQVEAERMLVLAQEELARLAAINEDHALHDALTGLGNRRKLLLRLEQALGDGHSWLIALFDLDGFKRYNDTFGHPAGDDLLVRLSTQLGDAMPAGSAFRLGGMSSWSLHERIPTSKPARAAARALSEEGHAFDITSSFGAAFIPQETRDPDAALELCDQRLYNEKRRRSDHRGAHKTFCSRR